MATERTVLVRLKANASDFNKAMMSARASVKGLTDEIDTTNDRTAWLAQSVLALGPAFVPLGAAGIPVVAALATQLGVATLAAGTAALAFHGIGDGLKALNDYQLDPTAANMEKLAQSMEKIGPEGEQFVNFLDHVGSQLGVLSTSSRRGIFPGFEEGITRLLTLLPQVNRIVTEVAQGIGELGASTGAGLSGERFAAFFDYLETDAKPILLDMGRTVGGFVTGLANLIVQFGPLTAAFSGGFADMADSFAAWSMGLDDNSSFQSFLQYVQEAGPKALDLLGSLIDMFAGIVQAAAPVGETLLPIFSTIFEVIGQLAQTPLGPLFIGVASAVSLYGRAVALASVTTGGVIGKMFGFGRTVDETGKAARRSIPPLREFGSALAYAMHPRDLLANPTAYGSYGSFFEKGVGEKALRARDNVRAFTKSVAPATAQMAALGLAASGAADSMGLTNSVTLGLAGSFLGAPGAAIGTAVGLMLDLKAAGQGVADTFKEVGDAASSGDLDRMNKALDASRDKFDQLQRFAQGFNSSQQTGSKSVGDFLGGFFNAAQLGLRGHTLEELEGDMNSLAAARDRLLHPENNKSEGFSALFAVMPAGVMTDKLRSMMDATAGADDALRQYMATFDEFNGVLDKQQGLINYRNSLRELAQVAKDNPLGKTLKPTKQGDAVRAQLLGIIGNVRQLASNMTGLEHVRFMRQARKDILARASELGIPLSVVRTLLRQLGLLDVKQSKPKVNLTGAEQAMSHVANVQASLNRLDGKVAHTSIITTVSRRVGAGGGGTNVTAQADGGPVRARFMGETMGPRDDTILTALSHREYVQPVAAVDWYGEKFMEDVRMRRLPRPRGYADGGLIGGGGGSVSVAAPVVNAGDTAVAVYLDGKQIDARVDVRVGQHEQVRDMRKRGGN